MNQLTYKHRPIATRDNNSNGTKTNGNLHGFNFNGSNGLLMTPLWFTFLWGKTENLTLIFIFWHKTFGIYSREWQFPSFVCCLVHCVVPCFVCTFFSFSLQFQKLAQDKNVQWWHVSLSCAIQYFSSLALSYHFITYAHLGRVFVSSNTNTHVEREFLCNFDVSRHHHHANNIQQDEIFSTFYYNNQIRTNIGPCYTFFWFFLRFSLLFTLKNINFIIYSPKKLTWNRIFAFQIHIFSIFSLFFVFSLWISCHKTQQNIKSNI